MKRVVAILSVLMFASCALFTTPDAGPAQAAASGMKDAFMATSNAFEKIINHPKVTMDASVKVVILEAIMRDRKDFDSMQSALVGWLSEVGTLDWKALYEKAREAYEELRN